MLSIKGEGGTPKGESPFTPHGGEQTGNNKSESIPSTVIEHDEDINSRYEIDRERNDGLQHPYDEVVRNKSSRKRMHAVDCPCCKDVRVSSAHARHVVLSIL